MKLAPTHRACRSWGSPRWVSWLGVRSPAHVSPSPTRQCGIMGAVSPGDIAQLGERGVRNAEVGGSTPPISTTTHSVPVPYRLRVPPSRSRQPPFRLGPGTTHGLRSTFSSARRRSQRCWRMPPPWATWRSNPGSAHSPRLITMLSGPLESTASAGSSVTFPSIWGI